MTTETEALRARFELEFGKWPYEFELSRFLETSAWAGQYTSLYTQCGWIAYRAGHAAAKAETAAAGEPVAFAHFAENGNIRLWAPERPRDLDGKAAHPLYTADQLTAAADAEREKCAGIVNELRMECARRNMPESATMLWHAEDAIRAGAKEASDG